jgi:hypothetical protein
MAAPQFSASKRATPSRNAHRFTLDQANRSLPLVKRIVSDIVRTHTLAASRRDVLEQASGKDAANAQREYDSAIERLEQLLDELSEVGVELKDYHSGLVDFVGKHEGRDVYLCWKLGEERIAWWHELNAGFAGRKSVALLREK